MPAMHLISVDLPAPLSPTSAITSPVRISKSTSLRAWTDPNDFETPRSSRRGWSLMGRVSYHRKRRRRPEGRLRSIRQRLFAVLGVRAVADLFLLQEARSEEELVVLLRDRLRCDQVGRLYRAALRFDRTRRRDLRTLDDCDRRLCGCGRQLPHVLEHRHRLPTGDDVLDALRAGVLTGERDRLQLVRFQRDDDRVREAVVGCGDCVDLVPGPDEHLLEDRSGLLVVPARHELLRAFLERAALVERIEDLVDAALEEERVRVLLPSPERGHDRLLGVGAL